MVLFSLRQPKQMGPTAGGRWAAELRMHRDTITRPAVMARSSNQILRWSVLGLIYLQKAQTRSSLLCPGLPVHRLRGVGMATPASSGCRSIPQPQLYLPCVQFHLLGGWRRVSWEPVKGLPSQKINSKTREYLSARACYWKTDLGSHKQEKDVEAYLYFCPWAQRG